MSERWMIELVQQHNNGTPRYYSEEVDGLLTATVSRGSRYSTQTAADAVIEKLAPHKWGRWESKLVEVPASEKAPVSRAWH